ncbi:MAG: acyl carrier protein [Betaproteobacteria bacterium]|nr:acyl carrier protein [Betaproteobacteria bacterium]
MTTTFERLSAILVKDYKVPSEALVAQATLESLGIDSLGAAELLFTVEDVFHITIAPEPVPLPTLGDVVAYIDGLMAAQGVEQPGGEPAPRAAQDPAQP